MAILLTAASLLGFATRPAPRPPVCWNAPRADAGHRRELALRPRTMVAVRLTGPAAPVIDGRLDDAAWCAAPAVGDFVQSAPRPGALASLPSAARLLYDDRAVYVAVRLFDPRPDSIVAPFPRRDDETTSDWVFVEIDTRFDRRSARSFGVNPRGAQADGAWADDVDYDSAWNGVWQGAARVDSLGWTAEFRIPYSELPLGGTPGKPMPWGINIYRYAPHRGETSNWAPRLPSTRGVVSHFNRVAGLVVPPGRVDLAVVPFTALTGLRDAARPDGLHRELTPAAGADLRLRPTASTSLALAIAPDFGQVEADPAQVNLTTFETFLPEQRPLFVEGAEVFRFPSAVGFSARRTSFAAEQPFYSRRVGGAPHGTVPAGTIPGHLPGATPVLGAIRLSGRGAAWSAGVFHAWTASVRASFRDTAGHAGWTLVEPRTRFTAARAVREFAGGAAGLGGIVTVLGRPGLSSPLDSLLPRRAVTLGADGRRRFARDRYEVTGFALASRVTGSRVAIAALRAAPRHGYARPATVGSPGRDPDSLATSLTGFSAQARLARIAGGLQWGVAARVVTQGFETNDMGFQRNADWLLSVLDWQYRIYRPGRTVRRWSLGSTEIGYATTIAGRRRAAVANLTASADFANFWGGSLGLDHEFSAYDPEVLRGGPSLLLPPHDRLALAAYTDTRRRWQVTLRGTAEREWATGSAAWSLAPDLIAFLTDRLQIGLTPSAAAARTTWQFVASPRDTSGTPHYLLGRLRQHTVALTARATYAFSTRLTLQLYAQAFVGAGAYDGFAEVVDPRAAHPSRRVADIAPARLGLDAAAGRYVVDAGDPTEIRFADPAFSERDLHVNAVLRWEYLPGSTLFVVWTQGRHDGVTRPFAAGADLDRLLRAPATNALQVKVSCRLAP